MDQAITIDWEPILWVAGVFMLIISGLLTWIGLLTKAERESAKAERVALHKRFEMQRLETSTRLDKHDEEIHELALQNRETLTIMKHRFGIQ